MKKFIVITARGRHELQGTSFLNACMNSGFPSSEFSVVISWEEVK